MGISGHKTRVTFDRYKIASESDLARAIESASSYHCESAEMPAKVIALTRGRAIVVS